MTMRASTSFVHVGAGRYVTSVRKDCEGLITIKRWHPEKGGWSFTVECHGGGRPEWRAAENNGNYEASCLEEKGR
jgi:hypothetical protein